MIEKLFTLEKKRAKQPSSGPIIMVDDSDIDIYVATKIYDKSGLTNPFHTFTSGNAFLGYMQSVKEQGKEMPSAVLLDLNMPGMNGFEVLERIRSQEFFADIPIVVILTNSNRKEDWQRAEALGADAFKTKPAELSEYKAFFERLVA